ncbi:helix-turn-helix domain-containing protein [Runella sp.]|jgi:HTH-type transcriptional regulator, competence development regulator|uniref:helix-turn-helix domain-containing protein n=1 Tax=Runella sp. TaxID=1960881 RepID=UPI0026313847|nr:helix-turn-helix transcriptional regulator [Runella sp.]
MEKTVGKVIREARELKRLTLREVEIQSGISNAYLSQLENDKIKKPSANTLYKLSELFNISFDDLMVMAGIVEKKKDSTKLERHFALSSENLTTEEEEELLNFLKYMRFRDAK